ncbi:MAG: hypothetical protein AAFX81_06205 [Pseudomonadota bacterium]
MVLTRVARTTVLAIVLPLGLAACAADLLRDDFESYDDGAAVGGGIDGEPEGDTIVALGSPELFSVRSGGALSGAQSLVLEMGFDTDPSTTECPPPGQEICQQPFVLFFVPLAADPDGGDRLYFWNGRLEQTSSTTTLTAGLFEPGQFFGTKLALDIAADQLTARQGLDVDAVFEHDFTDPHSIFVRISPGRGTYAVQIAGGGIDAPANDQPACAASNVLCGSLPGGTDFASAALFLRLEFTPTTNVGARYRVDNVRIWQLPA